MSSVEYDRFGDLADREAVGESLTADEREFLVRFAAADAVAAAEVAFFDALASLEGPSDEIRARRLADTAVMSVVEQRKKADGRRGGYAAVGVLAAAAAAALWVAGRPAGDGGRVASVPGPSALVEVGAVFVAGSSVQNGGRIQEGAQIEARGAAACVALEPTIHICLADGARVRLSRFGGGERKVELLSGRVAAALAPLPPGEHFSVVAGAASSTAIGTAFTVELRSDGAVETIVHEGKVKVGAVAAFEVVPSHRIGLVRAGAVSVEALDDHARRAEAEEWAALAKVAGRSVEAELTLVTPPEAHENAAPSLPRSTGAIRRYEDEPRAEVVEAAPATPASLLAEARQALRAQRWAEAAGAYRKLVTNFPGTAEASIALVPLAGLEIDRLGQPAAALARLDSYLAVGGPLVMEARLSRIRALGVLGRTSEEAHAIDEFLSAHPNALDAARLRERRDALRPR